MNTAIILITLTGMTLEFLSFWFVAPEILGQDRLERFEGWIERPLSFVQRHPNTYGIFGAITGILVALIFQYFDITIVNYWITFIVIVIAGGIAGYLVGFSASRVISTILSELTRDERIRRRAIVIGAVMFIISFLFQFTAVLLGGFTS